MTKFDNHTSAKSNSFFSHSLFIFIIRFFPSLANLLVMIWYSKYLPADLYGNYLHFWIQLNVIAPFACFGIHVLIITYSPGFVVRLMRSVGRVSYMLFAIWMMVLSGLFAWLQSLLPGMSFAIPFLFLLCFSLSVVMESLLVVYRHYRSLTVINMLYSAAFWLIHYFVLKQGFSLHALFTYLLILTALRLCIYSGMVMASLSATKEDESGSVDMTTVKQLWVHLGIYDVSQVLFNYIDKFIISIVLVAQLSAIYYNGSETIPFLPLLLSAAGSAILILTVVGGQDGTTNLIRLMNQSGRVLSSIVFPVFFFLFFFRHEFIVTVFTDKYIPAIPIFAASIMVLPVKAYSFTTVLQKMHKGAIINAGAVADLLLACVLMYPLYLWLGLPGVALSFVISTYLQAGFYLMYTARLLDVSPLRLVPYANWLVKLIVFALLFIAIHYACNAYFTQKIGLILGGGAMAAICLVSLTIELKKDKHHVNPQP